MESVRTAPLLGIEVAGIPFAHPVLAAAGPLGMGREAGIDLRPFAGFVTKSATVEPRAGNPRPQVVEVEGGWLNSVGLANPGLAVFLTRDLPFLRSLGIPIIVSVAGESLEEFRTLVEWLGGEPGVSAIEVNVSCPNVEAGMLFGTDPHLTYDLVSALRPLSALPLWVKLTPTVADVVPIARAAEDAGADALCLINTLLGMAIDIERRRPLLGGITGGLSGPAIRPVAVRTVWQVAQSSRLPIVGMGGIANARDALEFLLAGARAVAVGSAVIQNPGIATEIRDGLERYLADHGIASIAEVVGALDTGGRS